jgi:hypothetical protein
MPIAYISDSPEGRILTQLARYETFYDKSGKYFQTCSPFTLLPAAYNNTTPVIN